MAWISSCLFSYVCLRIFCKKIALILKLNNNYLIKVVNGEKQIFKLTSSIDAIKNLPPSVRYAASYAYLSFTWGFVLIEFR